MAQNYYRKSVSGTRVVSIYTNDGDLYHARVYVNCDPHAEGCQDGDATLVARSFKTLAGAERWADKQVAS